MAKKLLFEELGAQYIREWFHGALFVHENKLHCLQDVMRTEGSKGMETVVVTTSLNLLAGTPKWSKDRVPPASLVDFSTFKYPKLGYRQFYQDGIGMVVAQCTALRAAQRGLRLDTVRWDSLPVYTALDYDREFWDSINQARIAKEIFAPTFTPFSVGIHKILEGEIPAFAINEDLAVGLACVNDGNEGCNVYFRGRVVGNVSDNGHLTITNKILQRDNIKKKLFK